MRRARCFPPLSVFAWLLCTMLGTAMAWHALAVPQDALRAQPVALVMRLDGAVSPASADYFRRGLERASAEQAEVVVLELDTPGGLYDATRSMIAAILGADVPVVVYVAPEGARAASAGTYLLYASHIAAMAPATHLGAATPIDLLGSDDSERKNGTEPHDRPPGATPDKGQDAARAAPATTAQRKQIEDAVAYIRALAERRGRNADWAERAVREAVTLTANEAEQQGVIDLIAPDLTTLLARIDGREVALVSGMQRLATAGITLERFDPDWRTRLLAIIANPTVAYMLLLAGLLGLTFELLSPGLLVPGVLGTISLMLAFYAFQILPISVAGLALLFLGIVLIAAEAFAPGLGILGFGGLAAFVVGSVMLLDDTGLWVSLPLIGGTALVFGGLLLWMVVHVTRLRHTPAQGGQEGMIGAIAVASDDFDAEGNGHVQLHGERWNAHAGMAVRRGQSLRVTAVDGLRIEVEPCAPDAQAPPHHPVPDASQPPDPGGRP